MDRRATLLLLAVSGLSACDEQKSDTRDPPTEGRASASSLPEEEPFKFGTDLEAGIALASREKRPLLVFFSAEWNVACKEQQKVFATPEFKRAATRFVGVLVDVTDDESPGVQKAMLEHKIAGLPAVLVADSTGKEVRRFQTLQPLESWLELLAQVK